MPHTETQFLRLEFVDDVAVVHFAEPRLIAEDVISDLGEQLYSLVDDQGHRNLLLNFTDVQLMSSSVLGKVIGLYRKLGAQGGTLKLCCITPSLLEVFKLCQFDRILEIHNNEATALDAF